MLIEVKIYFYLNSSLVSDIKSLPSGKGPFPLRLRVALRGER